MALPPGWLGQPHDHHLAVGDFTVTVHRSVPPSLGREEWTWRVCAAGGMIRRGEVRRESPRQDLPALAREGGLEGLRGVLVSAWTDPHMLARRSRIGPGDPTPAPAT